MGDLPHSVSSNQTSPLRRKPRRFLTLWTHQAPHEEEGRIFWRRSQWIDCTLGGGSSKRIFSCYCLLSQSSDIAAPRFCWKLERKLRFLCCATTETTTMDGSSELVASGSIALHGLVEATEPLLDVFHCPNLPISPLPAKLLQTGQKWRFPVQTRAKTKRMDALFGDATA